MIKINNPTECCGCGACSNVCPKHAINMIEDREGFLYPTVDISLCVNCGLCDKVCPMQLNGTYAVPTEAYVVQNRNDTIRRQSTSGASINAIAEEVLSHGGFVYGVELSNDLKCRHIEVTKKSDLKKLQGSKYVQSDTDNVYRKVRERLKEEKEVLFIGTPCQVTALKSFLKKDYEKLLCIDFACHGVPSPGVFREYVQYIERVYHKKVKNINFRDKSYGYAAQNQKITFVDGSTKEGSNAIKTFLRMMFNGLILRPTCYECKFKTLGRASDITVYDCQLIGKFYPDMDDNKGTSNLIVHTNKGHNIISSEYVKKHMDIRKVDINAIIEYEGIMLYESAKINPRRAAFFDDYQHMTYGEVTKKYAPGSIKIIIGNSVKFLTKFMGPFGKTVLKRMYRYGK